MFIWLFVGVLRARHGMWLISRAVARREPTVSIDMGSADAGGTKYIPQNSNI